jgi:hypothetical protein
VSEVVPRRCRSTPPVHKLQPPYIVDPRPPCVESRGLARFAEEVVWTHIQTQIGGHSALGLPVVLPFLWLDALPFQSVIEKTLLLPMGKPIRAELLQRISRLSGAFIENIGCDGKVPNSSLLLTFQLKYCLPGSNMRQGITLLGCSRKTCNPCSLRGEGCLSAAQTTYRPH